MEAVIVEIAKLSLGAGDVLVVTVPDLGKPEMLEPLARAIRNSLPDGAKYLILYDHVDLSVLTRAEIEART
jgi:hypothetical protein